MEEKYLEKSSLKNSENRWPASLQKLEPTQLYNTQNELEKGWALFWLVFVKPIIQVCLIGSSQKDS